MAKAKDPTRATVMEISRRLSAAYEADDLSGMEPHEITQAVRELMILSRRAGIALTDDYHPVEGFISTVAEYDEYLASDMLDDVRAMEIRDRRMLAEAEAAAARGRIVSAAGEIMDRSGTNDDELRSGLVTALMRTVPAPDSEYEAVETAREIERASRATAKSIEDTDTRAAIMSALPPSASPYGQIRSDQRLGAIQDSMLSEQHRWNADFENVQPTLTHAEVDESQAVARGEIVAASQGPRALREYREEHNLDTGDYA